MKAKKLKSIQKYLTEDEFTTINSTVDNLNSSIKSLKPSFPFGFFKNIFTNKIKLREKKAEMTQLKLKSQQLKQHVKSFLKDKNKYNLFVFLKGIPHSISSCKHIDHSQKLNAQCVIVDIQAKIDALSDDSNNELYSSQHTYTPMQNLEKPNKTDSQ